MFADFLISFGITLFIIFMLKKTCDHEFEDYE